jgi:signal transduction histidine kinase
MGLTASLAAIRQPLQMRVTNSLARGSGVRENFQPQLTRFFELLEQALESGNPSWLDPLLAEWSGSRTETDLEGGERNVTQLMNRIITASIEISRESLPESEALDLLSSLMPVYLYCIERATSIENQSRVDYVTHELEAAQTKLERLDKSKSSFISVAAHELKTPLTLIEGYAAMIGDFTPTDLHEIHMLVQGVHNGIRRMREIVDDMIDVSMIDNNLLSLNFQPIWLNRIFTLIKADFDATLKARKQTLVIKDFPGSDDLIFADQERIYQAVKYVVSNAIKYTPDQGAITIDGRTLPGFVEITISDTGIGIAPENHELIFEKFVQLGDALLHSSGKTKFKGGGPGLGLPIVRGIVQLHGGSIWVESQGCDEARCPGSTFHILLPLRTSPPDHNLAKLFSADSGNDAGTLNMV